MAKVSSCPGVSNCDRVSCLDSAFARKAAPSIELPWGIYEARELAEDPEIYIFENVRFGEIPERFGAPQFPSWTNSSVQPVSDGRNCIQIDPSVLKNPPGGENPIDAPEDPKEPHVPESEDCLFLDIYVPKWVFDEDFDGGLPVVVWIYGGAFAFGAKNHGGSVLYNGRGIISASEYQTIFVTGNYRMGAYGWLAGDYMQGVAQPNAGLYDQALVFEWVQNHISKVKGDKEQVSAWGESAGASSVLHHLIREDGKVDPTFKTFVVQSPAYQWAWDNKPNGGLDQIYKSFSALAGCGEEFDIDCLRESKNMSEANQELYKTVATSGLFLLGPSVDGKWITTLSPLAFANDKYWKSSIESTIVSHCTNEAAIFRPKYVTSEETFDQFLESFLPGSGAADQRAAIKKRYACRINFLGDWNKCITTVIRDASFTCNTRDLFSAYPDKTYMMRYAFPTKDLAHHGSDMAPLFTNNATEAYHMLTKNGMNETDATLYSAFLYFNRIPLAYKVYFASFAASGGDPNVLQQQGKAPTWPLADGSDGDFMKDVMTVRMANWEESAFVTDVEDRQNAKGTCEFWTGVAGAIAGSGGGSFIAGNNFGAEGQIPIEL
ncbi:Carboxylesterase [Microdochium trichocladiopsis]|uniref:Carboxylesterase n=1 Tax=Microdochium trichocladiopsis TaxID=1682393 RepID=A0A9P8XW12_9PEZI|nr:Carboxylesterase [Microdochium trichocladiopsis]KAH7018049.1 Carboxylesterase [Microdochium trichocladiopsis]